MPSQISLGVVSRQFTTTAGPLVNYPVYVRTPNGPARLYSSDGTI